uniref:SAP domain-containing protein n=2 Tax=Cacopsylla melanoneura TaxID=428564 RepID=A0A8D8T952_9HEMI
MVSKMFDDLSLENLKVELGRRNLKTSGSKAELQSRLRSALEADGEDLDSMEFLCEDEKAAVTMEFLAELICKITDQCNEMSDKIRKELSDKMTEQSKVMSEQIQGINSVYPSFPPACSRMNVKSVQYPPLPPLLLPLCLITLMVRTERMKKVFITLPALLLPLYSILKVTEKRKPMEKASSASVWEPRPYNTTLYWLILWMIALLDLISWKNTDLTLE